MPQHPATRAPPRRWPAVLALVAVCLLVSGCVRIHVFSYVDPRVPRIGYEDLQKPAEPKLVRLNLRFQRNGKSDAAVREELQPVIKRVMLASGVFAGVTTGGRTARSDGGADDAARLDLVVNNIGDFKKRAARHRHFNRTLGGSGYMVNDHYVFTANYLRPGGEPVHKTYRRVIHTTYNKKGPTGMTAVSVEQGYAYAFEQVILGLLRDLQAEGKL